MTLFVNYRFAWLPKTIALKRQTAFGFVLHSRRLVWLYPYTHIFSYNEETKTYQTHEMLLGWVEVQS